MIFKEIYPEPVRGAYAILANLTTGRLFEVKATHLGNFYILGDGIDTRSLYQFRDFAGALSFAEIQIKLKHSY